MHREHVVGNKRAVETRAIRIGKAALGIGGQHDGFERQAGGPRVNREIRAALGVQLV